MELPLQHYDYEEEALKVAGFNPCFNGTTSATLLNACKEGKIDVVFQSLF